MINVGLWLVLVQSISHRFLIPFPYFNVFHVERSLNMVASSWSRSFTQAYPRLSPPFIKISSTAQLSRSKAARTRQTQLPMDAAMAATQETRTLPPRPALFSSSVDVRDLFNRQAEAPPSESHIEDGESHVRELEVDDAHFDRFTGEVSREYVHCFLHPPPPARYARFP